MTTNSDEERITQIRAWADSFRPFHCTPENAMVFERDREAAHQMVRYLFSLLDRSAAGDAGVWANEVRLRLQETDGLKADTWSEKDQAFIDGGRAALERLLEDIEDRYTPARNDAATRMREACVGKVKAMRNRFQTAADSSPLPNDLTASRDAAVAAALTRLLGELESLTLNQVEQEKSK